MPLPLLGLATGIGKTLLGGAKKTGTVVKSGAKKTISTGKFLAKKSVDKGTDLARGGVKVARRGGKQVVKGSKFFKEKVGDAKRKGGEIAKRLKENATNLRDSLKKANKNQDKLRTKKQQREEKTKSLNKKIEKEKELESKQSNARDNKFKNLLAKAPLGIFDKLFAFGGILLGGILINAAQGLIDKGKKFMEDNKELFDTIGNFLTGVKDAVVGLLDSFTGPASEEGKYDWLAKFDGPKLTGGLLFEIEKAFDGAADIINTIDKFMGGKGDVANFLYSDQGQILAKRGGKEGILDKKTDKFYEKPFTEEERQRFNKGDTSIGSAQPAEAGKEDQPSTGPIDPAHGAGAGSPLSKTGFVAGKGSTSKRIFLHWSAGSYTTPYDAYHSIALGDGTIVRHTPYSDFKGTHTGGANSNSVGLAIAAAAGAQERGSLGQYAPTKKQLDAMIYDAARLAVEWGWSEGTIDSNVRTHGEWERFGTRTGELDGSPQRWDLDRLRDSDPLIDVSKDLSHGGNELRQRIKATFRLIKQQANISSSTVSTAANISPTGNQTLTASAISQEDDEENVIYIQTVEKRTYIPVPVMA